MIFCFFSFFSVRECRRQTHKAAWFMRPPAWAKHTCTRSHTFPRKVTAKEYRRTYFFNKNSENPVIKHLKTRVPSAKN